jgi:hypothetical protein
LRFAKVRIMESPIHNLKEERIGFMNNSPSLKKDFSRGGSTLLQATAGSRSFPPVLSQDHAAASSPWRVLLLARRAMTVQSIVVVSPFPPFLHNTHAFPVVPRTISEVEHAHATENFE